jgi:hypothetical protein
MTKSIIISFYKSFAYILSTWENSTEATIGNRLITNQEAVETSEEDLVGEEEDPPLIKGLLLM